MHAGDPDYIVCPMCLSALSVGPSTLTCEACQQRFKYHKGIPILTTQMVPSCQPAVTDLSASLFSQLPASLPERGDQTCHEFFMDFIQVVRSQGQASAKVLNMVDETKAVVKFLLDISPTSHVLNLGPGWDNTSVNLARTTAKVTVLDLDLSGLCVLSLKKKYYGLDNIELIFWWR